MIFQIFIAKDTISPLETWISDMKLAPTRSFLTDKYLKSVDKEMSRSRTELEESERLLWELLWLYLKHYEGVMNCGF